jgi:predicted AlkP superfamily pyrophosphatase or phosphodiesterase
MSRSFFLFLVVSCLISSCTVDEDFNTEYDCEEWNVACSDTTIVVDPAKAGRKVLVIGIDGFRADAMQESITPFLFSLATNPNTYYTDQNHVERLTFSGPNWSSLCTGAQFCKHRVTSNGFGGNSLDEFPHFFKYIEQAYPQKNTLSVVNWTPINEHIAGINADHAPIEEIDDHDVFLIAQNILDLGVPMTADVLFLQFDELDATGHSYGFHPEVEEYAAYLTTLDAYIEQLVSMIETKRTNGEDWLICVVSDHGGEGKGHSDKPDDDDVNRTTMFMNSTSETFNQWYTSSQRDLAPTILDFMGIESFEFNCKTDGVSVIAQ